MNLAFSHQQAEPQYLNAGASTAAKRSAVFALCAAFISLSAIAGWIFGIEILRNTFGGRHGLRLSTAILDLLVAAGVVVAASGRRPIGIVYLSVLVFLPLGLIEIAYSFVEGGGVLQPFAAQDKITDPTGPVSGLCLALISMSLLSTVWLKPLPFALKACPAVAALVLCLQTVFANSFSIDPIFDSSPFARVSYNAAMAHSFLAVATITLLRTPSPEEETSSRKDQLLFVLLFGMLPLAIFEHIWLDHVSTRLDNHQHVVALAIIVALVITHVFTTVARESGNALEASAKVLSNNSKLFERAFANAPIGLAIVSLDGTRLRVNNQHCVNSGRSAKELLGTKLTKDMHPDDVDPTRFAALASGRIGEYEREVRRVLPSGKVRWLHVHAALQRDIFGKPSHVVVLCHDIDENRQREEAHALIVGEMNHRIKNTLATVQGLAREIAERTQSPGDFQAALEARLTAISRAHDSLMQADWKGMTLYRIYDDFSNVFAAYKQRYTFKGEDVEIAPQASVVLSLVLHELMTNAVKYGAMSVPKGRLHISSSIREEFGERVLILEWSETGCQGITAPVHRGFGTFMLERGITHGLGGTSELVYCPEGLLCTLRIPVGAAPK